MKLKKMDILSSVIGFSYSVGFHFFYGLDRKAVISDLAELLYKLKLPLQCFS